MSILSSAHRLTDALGMPPDPIEPPIGWTGFAWLTGVLSLGLIVIFLMSLPAARSGLRREGRLDASVAVIGACAAFMTGATIVFAFIAAG